MDAPQIHVGPVEARHRDGVVDLYRACFPGVGRRPREEVERKLTRLFFDGPLCDATQPSLVACDARGAVVGFRGRVRRSWRFRDERLLGSTTSGLMVSPGLRRAGVSTALRNGSRQVEAETGVRAAIDFADRSTRDGRAFGKKGGRATYLEPFGFEWSLPLRPRRLRLLRAVEWRLPDGAARRWLVRALTAGAPAGRVDAAESGPAAPLRTTPLSAAALQEAIEAAAEGRALRIDESPEVWEWLLAYLADYPSRGRFSGRMLLGERGRPLGFYAGYASPHGAFELLGFAVKRDAHEAAFGAVLREAEAAAALLVSGVTCGRELRPLLEQGAQMAPGSAVAVSTPRAELLQRFQAMDVLLTGLEGERWL
jgi:hypothetical protein